METEDNPEPSWFSKLRAGEPLQLMQVGTIIWLIFLVLFVLTTKQCAWKWDVAWWRPDLRYFSCRTSNELGDFLAGAFAPLAFLWLAGAVFIQSRELKDQKEVLSLTRQELELTREEMGEQRKVMEAQAKEAKASAKFLGKQTEILSRQQALADQQAADDEFEEILVSVQESARSCGSIYVVPVGLNKSSSNKIVHLDSSPDAMDVLRRMANCRGELDKQIEAADFDKDPKYYVGINNHDSFIRLFAALQQCVEISTHLSSEGRLKYVRLRCQEAFEKINEIVEIFAMDEQKNEIRDGMADLEEKLESSSDLVITNS